MDEEDINALQYQFSGYQLPKVQLDAGFDYYVVPVHPYYFNQPLEWTKPAYTKYETTGPQLLDGGYPIQQPGYSAVDTSRIIISGSSGSSQAIIRGNKDKSGGEDNNMLPF